MITVDVKTSDSKVWNLDEVHAGIACAMLTDQDLIINLMCEGPAFDTLGIDDYIRHLNNFVTYRRKIKILTSNQIESHGSHDVIKSFPMHLIRNTLEYQYPVNKKSNLKHFGIFIGRCNAARLFLSSYLYDRFPQLSVHTNYLDPSKQFYAANLGLEKLISEYGVDNLTTVMNYIPKCPIAPSSIAYDKLLDKNHAQQLLANDREIFVKNYDDFAVEVVCETYFSGDTFFPTEKTWRPILLKTPFVLQGPRGFLKNLKKLGFKTFSDFWDEGYDEDFGFWSIVEITKVIDSLACKSAREMTKMIQDMEGILNHNQQRFFELTNESDHRNLTKLF